MHNALLGRDRSEDLWTTRSAFFTASSTSLLWWYSFMMLLPKTVLRPGKLAPSVQLAELATSRRISTAYTWLALASSASSSRMPWSPVQMSRIASDHPQAQRGILKLLEENCVRGRKGRHLARCCHQQCIFVKIHMGL